MKIFYKYWLAVAQRQPAGDTISQRSVWEKTWGLGSNLFFSDNARCSFIHLLNINVPDFVLDARATAVN